MAISLLDIALYTLHSLIVTATTCNTALSYQITDIVFFDVHPDNVQSKTNAFMYPALVADFVFLAWIYLAMTSTIRVLNEFKQTHKLEMYDNLWITIGVFVTQFLVVSIIMSMSKYFLSKFKENV